MSLQARRRSGQEVVGVRLPPWQQCLEVCNGVLAGRQATNQHSTASVTQEQHVSQHLRSSRRSCGRLPTTLRPRSPTAQLSRLRERSYIGGRREQAGGSQSTLKCLLAS